MKTEQRIESAEDAIRDLRNANRDLGLRLDSVPAIARNAALKAVESCLSRVNEDADYLHGFLGEMIAKMVVITEVAFSVRQIEDEDYRDMMTRAVVHAIELPREWWTAKLRMVSEFPVRSVDPKEDGSSQELTIAEWKQIFAHEYINRVRESDTRRTVSSWMD